jgi:hypothetical protein
MYAYMYSYMYSYAGLGQSVSSGVPSDTMDMCLTTEYMKDMYYDNPYWTNRSDLGYSATQRGDIKHHGNRISSSYNADPELCAKSAFECQVAIQKAGVLEYFSSADRSQIEDVCLSGIYDSVAYHYSTQSYHCILHTFVYKSLYE